MSCCNVSARSLQDFFFLQFSGTLIHVKLTTGKHLSQLYMQILLKLNLTSCTGNTATTGLQQQNTFHSTFGNTTPKPKGVQGSQQVSSVNTMGCLQTPSLQPSSSTEHRPAQWGLNFTARQDSDVTEELFCQSPSAPLLTWGDLI